MNVIVDDNKREEDDTCSNVTTEDSTKKYEGQIIPKKSILLYLNK